MKRLALIIIVITSILTLIPAYALERNVWIYSASAEICFETVPLSTLTNNYVEEEKLIVPADEEIDEELAPMDEKMMEPVSTTTEEELISVEELDEDLIVEDIASPVGETMIDEEQTELTTPAEETGFVDESDKENQTDEN